MTLKTFWVSLTYLAFQDLVLLVLTSGRGPGIIPRNPHPPEPEGFDSNADSGPSQTPQLRLPALKKWKLMGSL
ncbi:hypothetical protein SLEP1_g35438 [Rubroshorea leprosula]|uniref:Uncharacterized protein n=1 Tax=Rubroshorea leprosula TaxID=152421 RepID=A0AAV5KN76_9ROSI|nr:hypothetical protein SLEP1_g35438 [Rubroshorea leprosula]